MGPSLWNYWYGRWMEPLETFIYIIDYKNIVNGALTVKRFGVYVLLGVL